MSKFYLICSIVIITALMITGYNIRMILRFNTQRNIEAIRVLSLESSVTIPEGSENSLVKDMDHFNNLEDGTECCLIDKGDNYSCFTNKAPRKVIEYLFYNNPTEVKCAPEGKIDKPKDKVSCTYIGKMDFGAGEVQPNVVECSVGDGGAKTYMAVPN